MKHLQLLSSRSKKNPCFLNNNDFFEYQTAELMWSHLYMFSKNCSPELLKMSVLLDLNYFISCTGQSESQSNAGGFDSGTFHLNLDSMRAQVGRQVSCSDR